MCRWKSNFNNSKKNNIIIKIALFVNAHTHTKFIQNAVAAAVQLIGSINKLNSVL